MQRKMIYSIRAGDGLVRTMMNEEAQAAFLSHASSRASMSMNMRSETIGGSLLNNT